MKETQNKRHTVYECDFLNVYQDDVTLPNGKDASRIVIEHVGAAAVLPLTAAKEVILVRQYRYAIGDYMLEIPAGKKDTVEEDGQACALRELEEETGYTAIRMEKINNIHTAVGFCNEMIELFVAYDVFKKQGPIHQDEDEFIEVVTMPLEAALALVHEGKITDVKTIIALLSVTR